MTLAEFLEARLAEVAALAEAAARCRGKYEWYPEPQVTADGLNLPDAQFTRYWDPGRVLRQVTAMRAILAVADQISPSVTVIYHGGSSAGGFAGGGGGGASGWRERDEILRHLAAIWSDHPDYQQEWKP